MGAAALLLTGTFVGTAPTAASAAEPSITEIKDGSVKIANSPISGFSLNYYGKWQLTSSNKRVDGSELGNAFWHKDQVDGAQHTYAFVTPSTYTGDDASTISVGKQTHGGTGTSSDPVWLQTDSLRLTVIGDIKREQSSPTATDGLQITERMSYVMGSDYLRNDITVTNTKATPMPAAITAYQDCYLAGSDEGYVKSDGRKTECISSKRDATIAMIAVTPGSTSFAGTYLTTFKLAKQYKALTNDCALACDTALYDNASALKWQKVIPGNGTTTVSYYSSYVPELKFSDLEPSVSGPANVELGQTLDYKLKVTNNGDADATTVAADFTLPEGVTFVSSTGSNYDSATGKWTIGDLANGASAEITVKGTATTLGTLTAKIGGASSRNLDITPCDPASPENCGTPVTTVVGQVFDAAQSTISANPTEVEANGVTASTITVQTKDKNGINMATGGRLVELTSTLGDLSNVVDNGDGTYTATLSSGTSGDAVVSMKVAGASVPGTAKVDFQAGAASAADSLLTLTTGNRSADNSDFHTATVTVNDARGNGVGNAANMIKAVADPAAGVTIGEFKATATRGVYTAPVTSTSAGQKAINVTLTTGAGLVPGSGAKVNFTAGSISESKSNMTVSTGTRVAGVETHDAIATVKDANGNPIEGVQVQFTSTATLANSGVATTGADGIAKIAISSQLAGEFAVSATAGGITLPGSGAKVEFVAGEPSVGINGKSEFEVTQGPVEADGEKKHTATATIKDAFGNPVKDVTVTFGAAPGADLSAPTAKSNDKGIAEVNITSNVAETYSISAKVGTDIVKKSPLDVTFVNGAPVAANSSWKITPDSELTADGAAAFTAEITVRDKKNNIVKGTEIGLTSHDDVVLEAGPYVTGNDGIARVKLTSTHAGAYDVRAALGADQIGNVLSVKFVAGEPSLGKDGKSSFAVTSDTRIADGTDKHTATATILDATGNPVKDVTVSFAAPSDAKLSAATAKTNKDGIASVDVTSTVANTYAIEATVGDKDIKGSPANVKFVAGAPDLGDTGKSEFSVSGGTKKADGRETHTAKATIRDKNGNPVSGVLVDFAVGADATLSSLQAESGTDGVASVTVKTLKAGDYSVSAEANGTTVKNSPQTVKFVAGDPSVGDDGLSEFAVSADTRIADGEDAHTATATIRDANGNLIEGVTVNFATDAGSALSKTTAVTKADGTASVSVTSELVGSYVVSADVAGTNVKGSPASVTFVAGAPSVGENGKSTFSVTDGNKVANGSDPHVATAIIRDKKGNLVSGAVVNFGAGSAAVDAAAVTTGADGVAQANVTTTVADTYSVSATVGGTAVKGSPANVKFVADAPSVGEDGTSTFEVTPGGKTADGNDKHTATAIIRDANNNPVSNAQVDFAVENGATLSATSGTTDSDGKIDVNVVSQRAGSYLVSGTVSGTHVKGSPASVVFVAGKPDLGKDGKSSFGVTDGNRTADGADFHEATAIIRDAKGNPIEGISVDFAAATGATATPAAVLTDANGIATSRVTSIKAGNYSVSAAVGGVAPNGSPASVKFVAGAPDVGDTGKSSFAVTSGAVEANGDAKHTATATIVDVNDNPVEGVTVNFGAARGASLSAASAVTNDKGIATADITSTTVGFYAISANVAGTNVRNSPLEVQFTSGAASATESSWTVTPDGPVTADGEQAYTATVTVRDSKKNPVADQAIGFDVPAAVAVSAGPYVSDANGVVTATFTSTLAGKYAVAAKLGAATIGEAKDMVFTAGKPSVGEDGTSVFGVSTGTRIADGADTHTATATITDEFNNPVKGVKVTFGAENGATVSKTEQTTDENGLAVVDVTSEKSGAYAITAHVEGTVVKGSPASVEFIADVPSLGKDGTSEFSVTTEDKTADGVDAHTATATIRDAKGNPVPNAVVVFGADAGASLSETTVQTGANGIATTSITSIAAGTYAVTGTVTGTTIKGSPANVTFVAGEPSVGDLGLSSFEVSTGDRTADGSDAHTAIATVRDAFGNPVEGVEVSFGTDADAQVSAAKVSTNNNGIAEITVTSKKAGTYAVTADAAGANLTGSPASVTFVAGVPDLGADGTSTLGITTGNRVANGTDAHTATATIRDKNGNPVSGVVVDFGAATGATATPAQGTTGTDGVATADITSAVANTYDVTATVAGTPLKDSPATATFVPGEPSVGKDGTSTFSVTSGQVEADGVAPHTATATIRDASGNLIEGVTVEFESEDGSNVSAATAVTNDKGIASVNVTSATTGSYLVSASVAGIEVKNSPLAVEFIAGAPSAEESSWEITPSGTVTADGSDQFVATVTVRDKSKNVVPNTTIGFTVPSDVIISAGPYVTDANGVVTATLRSKKADVYQVSSQIGAAQIGDTKSIEFVAGAANADSSTITAAPAFAEANGTHGVTVTVTLFDEFGNPVLGGGDAVKVSSTAGTVSTVVDNGDGTYTATVTSVDAGEAVISFEVAGKDSKNTAQVEFIATPTAPTVDPTNGKTVTGHADANTTITVTNDKGETVGTGQTGATGEFTITLTAPTTDGDVLNVVSTESHGFSSAPASVTVDQVDPDAPEVDTSNGFVVKGRPIAPLDSVSVVDASGEPIPGNVEINDKGEFSFVPDVPLTETDNVFVVVTDPAGNTSTPVKVVVDRTPPVTPDVDTSNGKVVNGRPIDKNDTVSVIDENGDQIPGSIVVDDKGNFTFTPDTPLKDGDIAKVIVTDPVGNTSTPVDVVIDTTPPAQPDVDKSNGKEITGRPIDKDDKVTVIDDKGVEVPGTVVVDSDGNFTFTPDTPLTEDDKVQVVVTDPVGNESKPVDVVIDSIAPNAPVVNPSNGTVVYGTAEPGSTVKIYNESGDVIAEVTADTVDGSFSVPFDPQLADGTKLNVTATDDVGNESPATPLTIDGSEVMAPYVAPSKGDVITGTGTPGFTITVTLPGPVVLTTTVEPDGSWSVTPAADSLKHGDKVSVIQTNGVGTDSPATVIYIDQVPPVTPEVDVSNGKEITGRPIEPGDKVTVIDDKGVEVPGTVVVDPDGNFTFVPETPLTEGDKVEVIVTDPSGNKSEPVEVEIDTTPPVEPEVDVSNGKEITGRPIEPGDKVTVIDDKGVEVPGTVVVDPDGNFTFVPETPLTEGDKVQIVVTDPAGNKSEPVDVIVDTTPPVEPEVDVSNGKEITGRPIEPGDKVTVIDDKGVEVPGTVVVDPDGNFTFVPETPLTEEDKVQIVVTDPAGNKSEPVDVIVDTTPPVEPEVDVSNGKEITGRPIEPGDKVTVIDDKGVEVPGTVVVDPDGNFTFVPETPLTEEDKVQIVVTDPAGNESEPVDVVIDCTPPDSADVNLSNGKVVNGSKVEKDGILTFVDGKGNPVEGKVEVDSNGNFTFTPKTPLTEDDEVYAVVTDKAGNTSTPTIVPVDTTPPAAPIVDPSNGLTVTGGTIAPEDTLTVVDGAGVEIPGTVTIDENGRFTFTPKTPLKETDKVFVVVTDPVGNSVQVPVKVDTTKPKPPVVDPTDGTEVTGCAEPGATVTIRDEAGNIIGIGTTDEDCRFTIILDVPQKPGDKITVDVTDPSGNVSDDLVIRVGLTTVVLKEAKLTPGSDQVAYGYGFQPGETVTATLYSEPIALGTQVADANGEVTFSFTLPTTFELGTHTVTLSADFSGDTSATFEVIAPAEPLPPLAVTGGDILFPAAGGMLLLLAGAWFIVMATRRRNEKAEGELIS